MKEVTNEIFSHISKRIKSPLVFSFIVSWIVCNWEPIAYFFFVEETFKFKIYYVKHRYDLNFVVPVLISLIYTIVLPHLSALFGTLTNKAYEINIDNLGVRRNRQLTKDRDNAKLEFEIEEIKSGQKSLEEQRKTIEGLKTDLSNTKALNEKMKKRRNINQNQIDELKDSHIVLKYADRAIASYSARTFDEKTSEVKPTEAEFNYVKRRYDTGFTELWEKKTQAQKGDEVVHWGTPFWDSLEELDYVSLDSESGEYYFTEKGKLFANYLGLVETQSDSKDK